MLKNMLIILGLLGRGLSSSSSQVPMTAGCLLGVSYNTDTRKCEGGTGSKSGVTAIQMPPECQDVEISHECWSGDCMTASNANCIRLEDGAVSKDGWTSFNKKVTNDAEFHSLIDVAVSVSGGGWGFSAGASTKYMKQRSTTEKSVMFFLGLHGDVYANTYNNPGALKIKPSAKILLETDPAVFIKLYGKFYVSDVIYSTEFIGSTTLKSLTKSGEDSLNVDANFSFRNLFFNIDGSVNVTKTNSFDNTNTQIETHAQWNGEMLEEFDGEGDHVEQLWHDYESYRRQTKEDPKKSGYPSKLIYRSYLDIEEVQMAILKHCQRDANSLLAIMSLFNDEVASDEIMRQLTNEWIWASAEMNNLRLYQHWTCGDEKLDNVILDGIDKLSKHVVDMSTLDNTGIILIQNQVRNHDRSFFIGENRKLTAQIKEALNDCPEPERPPPPSPLVLTNLGASGCSSARPCNACEGDCETDAECKGLLKCFQRESSSNIPLGCIPGGGGDVASHDYCYDPSLQSAAFKNLGNSGCRPDRPCNECEGDCDSDNDCAGDLMCYQRESSAFVPVGCVSGGGGDIRTHDYCYDPDARVCPASFPFHEPKWCNGAVGKCCTANGELHNSWSAASQKCSAAGGKIHYNPGPYACLLGRGDYQCHCPNGKAASENCNANGALICESCNNGYRKSGNQCVKGYQAGAKGKTCAASGLSLIATEAECRSAFKALGFNTGTEWTGTNLPFGYPSKVPRGCSARGGSSLHWNYGETDKGRGDLTPVCKGECTGYQAGTTGKNCPQSGLSAIATEAECSSAFKALGFNQGSSWKGNYSKVPQGCSAKMGTHRHFNTGSGVGRGDLTPVCKSGCTGVVDDSKCIDSDCCAPTTRDDFACEAGYMVLNLGTVCYTYGDGEAAHGSPGSHAYDFTCVQEGARARAVTDYEPSLIDRMEALIEELEG